MKISTQSWAVLSEVEDTMANTMAPFSTRLLQQPRTYLLPLTSYFLRISLRLAILFQVLLCRNNSL